MQPWTMSAAGDGADRPETQPAHAGPDRAVHSDADSRPSRRWRRRRARRIEGPRRSRNRVQSAVQAVQAAVQSAVQSSGQGPRDRRCGGPSRACRERRGGEPWATVSTTACTALVGRDLDPHIDAQSNSTPNVNNRRSGGEDGQSQGRSAHGRRADRQRSRTPTRKSARPRCTALCSCATRAVFRPADAAAARAATPTSASRPRSASASCATGVRSDALTAR